MYMHACTRECMRIYRTTCESEREDVHASTVAHARCNQGSYFVQVRKDMPKDNNL